MPTQIKPFGVFTGTKTMNENTNASSSFGSVGCAPQQPASTPLSMQGLSGGEFINGRGRGIGGGAPMIRPM